MDQMKYHGISNLKCCPEQAALLANGEQFNLWFEAHKPILEYITASRASHQTIGLTAFGYAAEKLWMYWRTTKLISRTPCLTFVFQRKKD